MITYTRPAALLPRYDGHPDVRGLASAADAALAAEALGRFRSAQLNVTAIGVTTAGQASFGVALDRLEQSWNQLERLLAARLGDVEETGECACALSD